MTDGPADRISRRIKHITSDLKKYAEKRIELIIVDFGEKFAGVIAKSTQKVAGFVLLFGALVFLLVALALYIGTLLNSRSLGFVIVSIPFLICGYLFIRLKPGIITKKLRAGFEQELVGMLEDDQEQNEKYLPKESQQQIEKKKEYDV